MLDLIWTRTLLVGLPCLTQVGSDVQRILVELKDYRTFQKARSELASCPAAEVMPALEEFLEDDVVQELDWIRIGVFESARMLVYDEVSRTTGYVDFFVAGLGDRNASVRQICVRALETTTPGERGMVAGFVAEMLNDADAVNRTAAANCLGALGPAARQVLPELSTCLADPIATEREFWDGVRADPVLQELGDLEVAFRANAGLARIQIARDIAIDLDIYHKLDQRGRSASSSALAGGLLEAMSGLDEYQDYRELDTQARARVILWLRDCLCSGSAPNKEGVVTVLGDMLLKWRTSDPASSSLAREALLDYFPLERDQRLLDKLKAYLN